VPVILLTHRVREGLVQEAMDKISKLNTVDDDIIMYRVETLE